MPGVLLIEGMAQTAGAICIATRGDRAMPPVVYFMTIDNAKFRKPVVPGDTVEYHVRKLRNRGNIWKFRAEARVERRQGGRGGHQRAGRRRPAVGMNRIHSDGDRRGRRRSRRGGDRSAPIAGVGARRHAGRRRRSRFPRGGQRAHADRRAARGSSRSPRSAARRRTSATAASRHGAGRSAPIASSANMSPIHRGTAKDRALTSVGANVLPDDRRPCRP